MKKLILLSFVLLLVLTACGNNVDTPSDTTTAAQVEESITAETTEAGDVPDIGDEDYGGHVFNFFYLDWSLYRDYYFADSLNGDIINDAAYERLQKVEEQLKIDIQTSKTAPIDGGTEQLRKLRETVMAGDDTYDLLLIHNSTQLANYVSDRLVLNWQDISTADMDKSYWNQSVLDNMTLAGMTPFASNDFVLPDVNTIFFNTQMSADLNHEDPYSLVLNNKWTWDKLTEMASSASADLNGDGTFDDQDQYGFVGEVGWQFGSIPTSCNQYTIIIGNDGTPQLNVNTTKMVSVIEKMNQLINSGNNAFIWPFSVNTDPNAGGVPPVSFDSGRALFYLVPMSLAKVFRETDVDFGILPLPKYDEQQEDYITLNWAGFLCVPMTVSDPELVGKVSELLAYYSKSTVIPAFYNVVLGQKISRNQESIQMLDIIFENTVYDLGIHLGSLFYHITADMVKANNNDFASYYAKNENNYIKTLDDYYKVHEEYMNQ